MVYGLLNNFVWNVTTPYHKMDYFYENHNYSCNYGLLKGLKGSDFNRFFKGP
jgi:hypothetical protein